ncbi:hypothetical protein OSB04_017821 [Centaurea solstitialis]|uniref:3-oxo-5-alpha-steroid 4-dehydrogenase C-terminal domain-containing protein n=1 Tax=Centaurea solstitialis TaxID=347529 RepID=A0AA38WMD2_9ASTR|nr:hypothetical protein OSB04_017821 [Centaurea solstitialis]
MTVVSFSSLTNAGYKEIKGKHMQYSKFLNVGVAEKEKEKEGVKLSSKNGMLLFYAPSFCMGLTSFFVFQHHDPRFVLFVSALTIHFFKRVLEVLFLHKYSGSMALESAIVVATSYALSTATMIYAQFLSQDAPEPSVDLKYVGLGLFMIGIMGNLYHHWLLANLRKKGDKGYKIPEGGLFDLVICPHFLFEIFTFVGISSISQTPYAVFFTLGTIFYLTGRSYATREWYLSRFGDKFPKNVKAIIPYIF